MKIEDLVRETISNFLKIEFDKNNEELDFFSKIEIVQSKIEQAIAADPLSAETISQNSRYDYEILVTSKPNDIIKLDGWIPVTVDHLGGTDDIDQYIESGLVRKAEEVAA